MKSHDPAPSNQLADSDLGSAVDLSHDPSVHRAYKTDLRLYYCRWCASPMHPLGLKLIAVHDCLCDTVTFVPSVARHDSSSARGRAATSHHQGRPTSEMIQLEHRGLEVVLGRIDLSHDRLPPANHQQVEKDSNLSFNGWMSPFLKSTSPTLVCAPVCCHSSTSNGLDRYH